MTDVVIVGGGWAGLTAAVELSHAGRSVTLVESARQLGGRARCVRFGDARVDNGQHILVGAYHGLLTLLTRLGLQESQLFQRSPLALELVSLQGPGLHLRTPRLPAPLHLLAGLMLTSGLSLADRLAALRFGNSLRRTSLSIDEDISVQALLVSQHQPAHVIRYLWEPLCVAALNTPIQQASARIFLRVLQQTFSRHREDSDLLLPTRDLGSTLPEPALHYIEQHGGRVLLHRRVTALDVRQDRVQGVWLDQERLDAEQLILAVNPVTCQRLLSPHEACGPVVRKLAQLQQQPITTVYLRYPERVSLGRAMLGMVRGTAQWIFDRGLAGQPGYIAVVISAEGPHTQLDNAALTERVSTELAQLFPTWPAPEDSLVIREKRATFASTVGVDALRPGPQTGLADCLVAGDFTATGLPGTLEGAVLSGQACARALLHANDPSP